MLRLTNCFFYSFLLFSALFTFTVIQSCGPKSIEEIKPDPEPKPGPKPDPKPKDLIYELIEEKNVEFIEFSNGKRIKDLKESDIKLYFAERVGYFKPDSLKVKEDSLYIYKKKLPTEGFKIRWENNKLFRLEGKDNEWKHLANRNPSDSIISINISYFKRNRKNEFRSNLTVWQQYTMTDYQKLIDSEGENNSTLIWLSRNYLFIPKKSKK